MSVRRIIIVISLLLAALLLAGCGSFALDKAEAADDSATVLPADAEEKTEPSAVALPDGTEVAGDTKRLDLSGYTLDEILTASELFDELPQLQTVELGSAEKSDLDAETLQKLQADFPQLRFLFKFRWNGEFISLDTTELDLSEAEKVRDLLPWLKCMPKLKSIQLGSGDAEAGTLSWKDIAAIGQAAPQAKLDYAFTLYGRNFTLQDEKMDLNHIKIADQGALVKQITACMPKLNYLDMDSCGVDDEHMAEIRDALPEADVVWRIWFGVHGGGFAGYSVRTDVVKILASNPGIGGNLTTENTQSLKYCTKVKYLDLGHNDYLREVDFLRYMPDLEILILAMADFYDISPIENCTKLRYAELQTSSLSDLRPLMKLKNLTDLNICYCFALHDISPLYELPQLKRLYIGCLTPVPEEQVERMREIAPDCEIDTEVFDPTYGNWRYLGENEWGENILAPAYKEVREIFQYSSAPSCYAYYYNDPLYYG